MANLRFLIFDTETTGLPLPKTADIKQQPKIIEFGAVLTDGEEVLTVYNQLIDPQEEITETITKITGIKTEDLIKMPTFPNVFKEIKTLIENADFVIAHNASFDVSLVEFELERIGEKIKWPEIICTAQEYTPEFGFRPKLINLYEKKIGKPLAQTHRASDDAAALFECLKKDGFFDYFIGE